MRDGFCGSAVYGTIKFMIEIDFFTIIVGTDSIAKKFPGQVRPLQIDFLFPVLAKQNLACGWAVNSIIPLC